RPAGLPARVGARWESRTSVSRSSVSRTGVMCISVALWSVLIGKPIFGADAPLWSSDRTHRLLVRVPPASDLKRASDEMVARIHLNFADYCGHQRVDLSTLQVVGISKSGEPL